MKSLSRSLPVDDPRWWSRDARRLVRILSAKSCQGLALDLGEGCWQARAGVVLAVRRQIDHRRKALACRHCRALAVFSALALDLNAEARQALCLALTVELKKKSNRVE